MNQQLLVSIIESIKKTKEHYPGKKELQKTVYLLQSKGLNMGYSYRFYFYGPYSDTLDEDIQRLAIQGIVEIKPEEMTHRIIVKKNTQDDNVSCEDLDFIQATAAELKAFSPTELELMTTILFLINSEMVPANYTEQAIIHGVMDVKGKKYSEASISEHFHTLKENHYIQ